MFETTVGPVKDAGSTVYLRPETAQGIFLNFKNVLQFARKKPPFGIAQVGKSFRNEITPGNFIFRTREFEQMEMEFFVPPAEAAAVVRALDRGARWTGTRELGIRPDHLRLRPHDADELRTTRPARATSSTCSRSAGPSSRASPTAATSTSRQHAEYSGEKLEYFDTATGERYVPHVIEPAAGADRATLAFLVDAYDEEEIDGEHAHRAAAAPARWRRSRSRCCRSCARTASPSSRARSTRRCAAACRPSTTRAARSASATAARTRSARRGA